MAWLRFDLINQSKHALMLVKRLFTRFHNSLD